MSLARPGAPAPARQTARHPAGEGDRGAASGAGRCEHGEREAGRVVPSEGLTPGSGGGSSQEGASVHAGSVQRGVGLQWHPEKPEGDSRRKYSPEFRG